MIRTLAAAFATSTCIVALVTPAAAQTREFKIPAGSLKSALDAYVRQSGRQVVYRADQVRSVRSPGARGPQSAEAALAAILSGSGFTTRVDGNLIAIVRAEGNGPAVEFHFSGQASSASSDNVDNEDGLIVVTGSRIRGAQVASPTITIGRQEMVEAGRQTLGEVIRAIPQNYAGGQNPTVTLGAGGIANQNVNNGSALNLRGLGADATLTLINGNRLAFGGFAQSIDISVVPVGAVQRLEIVTDGASALYESDAVAGVANVITRKDFNGLETSTTMRGAADGGLFGIGAAVTAGNTWQGGSVLIAYDFQREHGLQSQDRRYLNYMLPGNTVFPESSQHSVYFNIHQKFASGIRFDVDGMYLQRSFSRLAKNASIFLQSDGSARIFSVAPSFGMSLGNNWELIATATYGFDKTESVDMNRPGFVGGSNS